jgi:hypothetical protein
MEEKQSWITDVYQEFWDKASELATKEYKNDSKLDLSGHVERRDKHLDAMVSMFMATMIAPEDEDEEENPREC